MIFDYLFLSWRYDQFAFQSEFLSTITAQSKNKTIGKLLNDYSPYRHSMAHHMMKFQQQTSTVLGWVKSFLPWTIAFVARTQLGKQLKSANGLYLEISLNYFKEQKKNNHNTQKQMEPSHKKETVRCGPDPGKKLSNTDPSQEPPKMLNLIEAASDRWLLRIKRCPQCLI